MKTVLIADDEDSLRLLYAEILSQYGYHVCVVDNGTAALDCVTSGNIDVALLDNQMPGLTGVEVCAQISDQIPVIIWSGIDCEKAALEAGARYFLPKQNADSDLIKLLKQISKDE